MNKRENRGITLIALIITIIVMLILVGVTVNVALNGNLFKNAQDASEGTGKARIDEEIQAMIASEMNATTGTLSLDSLTTKIATIDGIKPEDIDTSKKENGYITVTYNNGEKVIINNTGTIEELLTMTLKEATQLFNLTKDENTNSYTISGTERLLTDPTKTDIKIPSYIDGIPVTKIGFFAEMEGNSYIEKISIPNGIVEIGESAFANCANLKEITIPDSVRSIGGQAFYNCTEIKTFIAPSELTSIGNFTFANCTKLTSITISNKVESIGMGAFNKCVPLTKLTIPNSVKVIGTNAFFGCTNLTSIEVDNTTNAIGGSPWGAPNAAVTWLR